MSLVQELQRDASGSSVPTSELMRKALIVARKLQVRDFAEWIEHELRGYPSRTDLPKYRTAYGDLMAQNPMRGWIPVQIVPQQLAEILTASPVAEPVSEIESMVLSAKNDPRFVISRAFNADQMALIHDTLQVNTPYPMTLMIPASQMEAVLQEVRNVILEWSLKLEEDGIMGEGLSFSPEEKRMADSHKYNIGTFIGTMNQSQLQQHAQNSTQSYQASASLSDVAGLVRELGQWIEQSTLPPEERQELQADLQSVQIQVDSPKPKESIIRAGLNSIKGALQQAALKAIQEQAPDAEQVQGWAERIGSMLSSLAGGSST